MHKRGFTLIELLLVVAIIGILTTIIIGNLTGAKSAGRDARRVSDIKQIQLALKIYYTDKGFYPATLSVLVTDGYLPIEPKDPIDSSTAYKYAAYNAGGSPNCNSNKAIRYHLGAAMESNSSTNRLLLEDNDYDPAAASPCTGGTAFHGNASACAAKPAGAATPDTCYDVTS
jgi:prepilin-type N-terminal cleavage/methylation domain-containing protein